MKKCETPCKVETVRMSFEPTRQQISFLVLDALSMKRTIDENLAYLKRISAAQIWFVSVAKHKAALTPNRTNSPLAAKGWIKDRLKTVVMAPCPKIGNFWKKLLMWRQEIDDFAQYNMLFPHSSRQRRHYHTFIPRKTFIKIEYTLVS